MNNEVVLGVQQSLSINYSKIFYNFVKRIVDIIAGICGIVVMVPLTVIVKIVSIASGDYGSIFFNQERIGKDGKLFTLYKFRTMVPNADKILYELLEQNEELREEYRINKKLKNDPRVTKIGKFLRRTSLDEFPQFINVLLGQMSVVGNRPYLPRERKDMGLYYDTIIITKPGITGLWQTSGRSNVTFAERLKLEKKYSLISGIKLDAKIFFKTIIQVLKKEGAN